MPTLAPNKNRLTVEAGDRSWAFQADPDWPRRPADQVWMEVPAVAIDSQNFVWAFARTENRVLIFAEDGEFIRSWGEGLFIRPHGLTIGPDNTVYCTDDANHSVRAFTPDGKLILTLGTPGQPSDTGATSVDYRTIRRAGGPFHFPTNVAIGPCGEIFVADGYGNACVHCFSPKGKLAYSWGESGTEPGQFHIPHGIAVSARGEVVVADRENSRIQFFSREGVFLRELTEITRPCQVAFDAADNLYVAELGYRAGRWPGMISPAPDATGGRVSIFSGQGELLVRMGGGQNPTAPGDFFAPHDIAIDHRGDVYVAEVAMSAGGNRGLVAPDCHMLQKLVRLTPEGAPQA
jgi:DNA-binding beta-propeller fold protein YncE